jgi:ethanolamine utilization cobalamin adenosyltransferase
VYPEKLTPSALQFLSERRIKIIEVKEGQSGGSSTSTSNASQKQAVAIPLKEPENGYLLLDSGQVVEEKPEAYTHLKGKMLVPKNHKRIRFRGQLDKLEALFIDTIIEIQNTGLRELVIDLETIFEYTKKIMRAEVLTEELPFIEFRGWSDSEIREYSHYPDKYFGVKHFTPDPKYGKVVAKLNLLRAQIRELEIAAVDAFYQEGTKSVERQDIVMALNRMSSLLYITMCQYMGGFYKI